VKGARVAKLSISQAWEESRAVLARDGKLIGTVALAAHQIALQIAAVMFMVPFGIAMAATVRVGHAAGRGDAVATRRAGFAAIVLGAAFMAAMTLLVALTRHTLPLLFLGADAPDPQTVALAASLLVLGATFFIADGVQTVALWLHQEIIAEQAAERTSGGRHGVAHCSR